MARLGATLHEPFFSGTLVSPLVPGKFPVALAGHGYNIDVTFNVFGTKYKHQSIEFLRPQADTSQEPAEGGINPAATWVRAQHSWHHGAGQALLDHQGSGGDASSDRERFRSSKGIDVWTKGQIGLLPDTTVAFSDANFNVANGPQSLFVAGPTLMWPAANNTSGQGQVYSFGPNSGTPFGVGGVLFNVNVAPPLGGAASDGTNLYLADGSAGIVSYNISSQAGPTVLTSTVVTGPIAYVKGRLLAANNNSILDVTGGGGGAISPLFTHNNAGFRWVGFAEGDAFIYAAGYAGHKSWIYKIGVVADASTLDQPVVAGQLADGEIISSIYGYLGFIFLGTNLGVRFCEADAQGNLVVGDVILTPNPVLCFFGYSHFVWFGLTNYDTVSTGLGRMDLRILADQGAQQLAWATDLMYTGQGTVWGVAQLNGQTAFVVDGVGVVTDSMSQLTGLPGSLVAQGQLLTGEVDYGMSPDKVTTSVDVHYLGPSFAGSYKLELMADNGPWQMIGYETVPFSNRDTFPTRQARGSGFELRHTLIRSATFTGQGPELQGWMLNAEPGGSGRELLIWAIMLSDEITDQQGGTTRSNVIDELNFIKSLHASKAIVTAQEGSQTYTVMVQDYEFHPTEQTTYGRFDNGVVILALKKVL